MPVGRRYANIGLINRHTGEKLWYNKICIATRRFDDGASTPEEMVCAAMEHGLSSLGISAHAPMDGEDWCTPKEKEAAFKAEMQRLKVKYAGKIALYTGLEYDAAAEKNFDGYEYIIGSGHVLDGFYVDSTRERAIALIEHFGGAEKAADVFFANYASMAQIPEVDIVGHFDLLTKYNEQGALYDTQSAWYRDAAFAAMETLNAAGKIFEMNTGAISRGYRTTPYPSPKLLRHLHDIGGRIVISSDSHSASSICCAFEQCEQIARSCGFDELWYFNGSGFEPEKLS